MSSIDERVVAETARSLGSASSSGGEGTSNPLDKSSHRRILNRINADEDRRSLDEVLIQHEKLMKELEEVRGGFNAEKRSLMDKLVASEASIERLQEEVQKVQEEAKGDLGFNGCLAQFRANGYSKTEHPAPFLSVLKALEDMPEEGEVETSSAPEK
ncbi:pentatricopeptide repeat-containing protein [Dorcoceras hygrometricum]|uniref:Pentatricopeptide repeat-containing protein n=1 Tax=Dorcoceras hygrometricum TaxID=472368 RepID=A0A2Z6ZYZ9_9LAMI|nr:pentatricopeptide repeat-containing protein [Dorcoceras hygrometricum]